MNDYWQLQWNQKAIRLDNLLQGKFAKDWRKLNRAHNKKLRAIYKQKEQHQKKTGGVQSRSHDVKRYEKEKER